MFCILAVCVSVPKLTSETRCNELWLTSACRCSSEQVGGNESMTAIHVQCICLIMHAALCLSVPTLLAASALATCIALAMSLLFDPIGLGEPCKIREPLIFVSDEYLHLLPFLQGRPMEAQLCWPSAELWSCKLSTSRSFAVSHFRGIIKSVTTLVRFTTQYDFSLEVRGILTPHCRVSSPGMASRL